MPAKLYIKNMVCPRCITTVQSIFDSLHIAIKSIQLGEVSVSTKINAVLKNQLEEKLLKDGFEL